LIDTSSGSPQFVVAMMHSNEWTVFKFNDLTSGGSGIKESTSTKGMANVII
jgi:hypothetical protein